MRDSFDKYYLPLEASEKPIEMSKNDDYTTRNLLDFSYHQNYYKLISTNLSRQTSTNISQQINLKGKSEKDNGTSVLFYRWKGAKKGSFFQIHYL